MKTELWPAISYESWKDTCKTLHLWAQIVGKIRLAKSDWLNHSWHATLYVTSRGLTTSLIPDEGGAFSLDFDFIEHSLKIIHRWGAIETLPLRSESVASFHQRLFSALRKMGIECRIVPFPNELPEAVVFTEDDARRPYDPEAVNRFWQAWVTADQTLMRFRARFIGKCGPVHLFWGGLDLAVTRFSGSRAPEHPGGVPHLPDAVTREAYSHAVSSCGFWPGNELLPYPAFYSYAYPQPQGFESARIAVPGAFYHPKLREFILPYENVRNASDPEAFLLGFLQQTYEAAAELGGWDRKSLEKDEYLAALQERYPPFHRKKAA